MAGIYLHIPYCKQACHYCDFHFSTQVTDRQVMLDAMLNELKIQKDYLGGEFVDTIYFGGGTPSILLSVELDALLNQIYKNYHIKYPIEITLEANPDDLNKAKLQDIKDLGINRLSIGIQSFDENFLRWMNRAHTAAESRTCLSQAQQAGFDNISIDIIYGIPSDNHTFWEQDLKTALTTGVDHISAYHLTIEEKTTFGKWRKTGKISEPTDEFALQQFEMLMVSTMAAGFVQYEISNFAKDGRISKHNSNYWKGVKYLGIGPSAHSFDLESRHYNISNNALYIKSLKENNLPHTKEILTDIEKANDYILTRLRTIWGVDINYLQNDTPLAFVDFDKEMRKYIATNHLKLDSGKLILTHKGKYVADKIISDLFYV